VPITRRMFLGAAGATGLSSLWRPLRASENSLFRTALIGSGPWGMNMLRTALDSGACKAVAVCDADARQLNTAANEISQKSGAAAKTYTDYTEMLKAVRPDVVIVATADRCHPQQAIAAVESGAHVYVETPVAQTIAEGRAMVNAARAANRVMQVGLQRRLSPHAVAAREFIRSGKAGKIGMVRAIVDSPAGPGQLDSWGVDWMDQILWISGEKGPRHVFSTGGRSVKKNNTDAPDTQVVCYEFQQFTAVWEQRFYNGNYAERSNVGCYFYGTEGMIQQGWHQGCAFFPSERTRGSLNVAPQSHQPDGQNIRELWADFLRCIQSGARPIADIECGHRATTMSLLGALSLRAGRAVQWDAENERCIGDDAANALLQPEYRKPHNYS